MNLKNHLYHIFLSYHIKKNPTQLKRIEFLDKELDTILVISNTALGDTLLSTPAIKSLKNSFKNIKIIALINKNFAPLFENCSYIDEIIPFHGGYKNFLQTIKEIKKHSPKISLIFHGNSPQDIMISIFSGCNFILKHPTKSNLRHFLSYQFQKKEQHTIEDRVDLVRMLGGSHIDTKMDISEVNLYKITQLQNNKKYIGFQIGAADIYKMWPIENFISLAKKILNSSNFDIVITGVKSEASLANKIVNSCGERVINLCGKYEIDKLPSIIKKLDLLITNDTGTMHLAIALKTPTISLFSPTSAKGIGAYQDINLHTIIQKDGSYIQSLPKKQRSDEAMRLIEVDEVYDSFRKIL